MVDGSIERHPGFSWRVEGYEAASPHRRAQMKRCMICDTTISQEAFRKAKKAQKEVFIPAMKGSRIRQWISNNLSDFDFSLDSSTMPLSVCLRHVADAGRRREAQMLAPHLEGIRTRLTITTSQAAISRSCDGSRCWICRQGLATDRAQMLPNVSVVAEHKSTEPPYQRHWSSTPRQRFSPQSSGAAVDLEFRRAPWKHTRHGASIPKAVSPSMSSSEILIHSQVTSMTVRKAASGAAVFADMGIKVPSGAVIRRDATRRNKLFKDMFTVKIINARLAPNDKTLYFCSHLSDLVASVIWIRGKSADDVAMFRLSADGGQGDLKVSFQLVYKDDSLFTASTQSERRDGTLLDAGVKRTFIIALINGATETYGTLSTMFDAIDFKSVKTLLHDAKFVFPVDMKMANIVLGIGPVGCAFPYAYSLWSPFVKYQKFADIRRTIKSIMTLNTEREAAELASPSMGKSPARDLYQLHKSVYHRPMNFVLDLCSEDDEISEFIVPAQLHIVQGIVQLLYYALQQFSPEIASRFLERIGVRLDDRHGRSGFVGNDARKIAASGDILESIMHLPDANDDDRLATLRSRVSAVANALRTFDAVITATMTVSLSDSWRDAIRAFGDTYKELAQHMTAVAPMQPHRSTSRLTPKLMSLLEEMPRWIERNNCSLLRISEQSFESIHFDFKRFSSSYAIPITGPERVARARRRPARALQPMDYVHTPSDGTRVGGSAARKRKRVQNSSIFDFAPKSGGPGAGVTPVASYVDVIPPPSEVGAPGIIGNVNTARQRRMHCLLGFNFRKLPVDACAQERVSVMLRWSDSGRTGAPPWIAPAQVFK